MIGGQYGEMFTLALRNIWGYKLRSFLTMLGISFGIMSVIAMVATGEGAQRQILEQIGRLGIRNIIINSVKPTEEDAASATPRSFVSMYGLKFVDYRQIAETIHTANRVLPVHTLTSAISQGSRQEDAKIHGVMPEHLELLQLDVVRGRTLGVVDGLQLNAVCVVRPSLLRQLGYYGDPLGHSLQVGEERYEIVGLLAEEEFTGLTRKALNVDARSFEVYAPYESILGRHGTVSFVMKSGSSEITDVELHQIVVEVRDEEEVVPTARMIEKILTTFHPVKDWEMIVPVELLAQQRATQRTFSIALLVIAGVSLLVGGIGIANIMLATITERTREIGVRRAMGAKKRHIVAQFLTETVTLSAAGGILGLLLGVGFLPLLEKFTSWPTAIPPMVVLLAIGISCAVGIVAGIWPATRAARMDPIRALRYE